MYRIVLIFVAIIVSSISVESLFSAGCDISADLPTTSDLTTDVARCIAARGPGGNPNSITEFVCPQGEFFAENNQAITPETEAYLTSVSIALTKTDVDIQKYMKQLQKTREPDPIKWTEAKNQCTEKITNIYANICIFGRIEGILNAGTKKYITTTVAYPQTLCIDRTSQKVAGWRYLQDILMSDGISKNQKNSTDTWVTQVKGGYARVLGSWHTYQKILARAVSKMTAYTKESN